MSVARGFGLNGKSIYGNVCEPQFVFANFIVDSTNGNGLGQRSLKSNGYVEQVYMNTSAAFTGTSHTSKLIDGIASGTSSFVVGMPVQGSGIPANTTIASIIDSGSITLSAATTSSTTGSITYQGVGSPNPAAGFIQVKFKNNFNYYLGGFSGFVSTVSGSALKIDNSASTAGSLAKRLLPWETRAWLTGNRSASRWALCQPWDLTSSQLQWVYLGKPILPLREWRFPRLLGF